MVLRRGQKEIKGKKEKDYLKKDKQNGEDQSSTKLRSVIPLSVHLLVSRLKT